MTFETPVQFEMKKLLRPKQMAGHLSVALLKKTCTKLPPIKQ